MQQTKPTKPQMKKSLIAAAIVAAVGFSAYFGLRPDPASSLTELQLANAEALSDPEITIEFNKGCLSDGNGCILSPNRYYPEYKGVY